MDNQTIQQIIDRVVHIATANAIKGTPLKRIVWLPPDSAAQDHLGSFAIEPRKFDSATDYYG